MLATILFLLNYIGLDVFAKVLRVALNTSDVSIYELSRAWRRLAGNNQPITLDTLVAELEADQANASIINAIERRFTGLRRSGLLTEDSDLATTLENELRRISTGGALVFNLKGRSSDVRSMVVSTVLSKLENLLETNRNYPPVFLFAEEAHLYIGDTDWDDIITRMRHLGTFQFYITNTPTSLPDLLIRQTDNLILFNLLNDEDFSHVTPATKLDTDTITAVAKSLPPRTCLITGTATKDYPFVVRTAEVRYAAGETRRFFRFENGVASIADTTPPADEGRSDSSDSEDEFSL